MSEIADLTHDSVFKELSSNRQFVSAKPSTPKLAFLAFVVLYTKA